ncbi:hypothetical protein [Spirosoma sordidisoli]|uniref:Uncharacterized protein n=1 Tax=Spirosoma sordidisoli TaxID=2502893 RepID=A0A4Q2UJS0_9BACT|nr:hypothetical protein [Spirosoma sordidisoli]RYC69747.1 hypothetical protein EQG79_14220 [Spirosoma sordidisoli]
MGPTEEFYRAYGESLASRLAEIAHSPARPAFVFLEDMGDPKELKLQTGRKDALLGDNQLVWEAFQEDLDTGGRDNYHSVWTGSVAVIRKATTDEQIRAARATARQLVLKAYALMLQDAAHGALAEEFIQVEVRQLPLEKIGPIASGWHGYGLQFSWTVPVDLELGPLDLIE